ncbi:hypothetical protein AB1E18_017593 [Capra hircus]
MEASASIPPSASTETSASSPETPAGPEQLDEEQVKKAVEALLAHSRSRKNANGLLLNENENFFLMVVLWKIPSKELRVRLSLPHGIRSDLADVCLFTKDEPNLSSEQTEHYYKKLLNKHGIKTISQIIPLRTLKKEYKAYEAKLRLLGSFDFFITDARIRRLLPSHLGRHFYNRKKVPVSVNLQSKTLSREINDCIGGTVLNISKSGSCSTIRIGHTGMPIEHIVENVVAVAKRLSQKLPEKWESVKLLFVKTERSVSLPVFSSFVSSQGEAKGLRTRDLLKKVSKKSRKKKERALKRQQEKKEKKLLKQARKAKPAPTTDAVAPKTGDVPAQDPAPQEETGGVSTLPKAQDDSEDEIPLLVPLKETPAAGSAKIQKAATGKKSLKKSPGPNTAHGKKRKASPALETPIAAEPKTPGKGPGKKARVKEEVEKERNSSLGKKDLRQTPKKPEAKFFTTARDSFNQIRLVMIPATQARGQWTWFQRLKQEFRKPILTIIASGIVLILISGGIFLYGLCRNSDYTSLEPEELLRHRTAHERAAFNTRRVLRQQAAHLGPGKPGELKTPLQSTQLKLIMIPAFPANSQWIWFQRITQEEVSRRCWLCLYLFYAVTLALLLGGVFITLFSGHLPFALVMTMIITGIVFFILTGLMYLCEANKSCVASQTRFIMISSPQVYGQSNWFPRITPVKCSYQLYKQFFLFFAVFIVLIFGIAMAAFPLDRKTLFLKQKALCLASHPEVCLLVSVVKKLHFIPDKIVMIPTFQAHNLRS